MKVIEGHTVRILALVAVLLTGCQGGTGSFDALEVPASDVTALSCLIDSSLPSTSTLKVASSGSSTNSFGVVPNSANCTATWSLNGTQILTDSYFVSVASSSFVAGPTVNTLQVSLSNGTSTVTRSWSITKNQAPVCASKNPSANPTPMPYSSTMNFTSTASDPDGDALSSFTWKFNDAANAALFTPVNTTGNTSIGTFVPTFSQVGSNQKISMTFTDTYDTSECYWNMDVSNPNVVDILSCSPVTSPVVVNSTGAGSTQTLQIVAINAATFKWYRGGSQIGGATSASLSVASSGDIAGTYAYIGRAEDLSAGSEDCNFTVKINAAPSITVASPTVGQTYRLGYGATQAFSVTATDGNSDSLTYTWKLDGATHATLPSGTSSTTFSPNFDTSLIGSHTVSVTVSDGAESASQSWTVEVNYFSSACNTLYNSSVGSVGGFICTLVGVAGMGDGLTPSSDQTQMRVRPSKVIDDGAGNWIITDVLNHSVHFFNRSGASITRFGKTIPAGKMVVIMGNGGNGLSSDNIYNSQFKLSSPYAAAYDSAATVLYVADYTNHRIAKIDNTGFVVTVFSQAGGVTNNTAGNTEGALGTAHSCNNPADLRVVNYAGRRWLYIACSGTHSIKRMDIDPISADYGKGYMVVGRLSSAGATAASNIDGAIGTTGYAGVNQPWALSDDGNGNIYWADYAGFRVRMATVNGSSASFYGGSSLATNAFTVVASDPALTGAITAGSMNTTSVSNAAVPTTVMVYGSTRAVTNECTPVKVYLRDATNATIANSARTITFTGLGGTGQVYTSSTCGTALPGAALTIPIGASEALFYYRNTAATAITMNAASTGLTAGTLAITTAAAGTATKLVMPTLTNFEKEQCTTLIVQAQNAGNIASTLGAPKTIQMYHGNIGTYFSDAACTTPTTTFTLSTGASTIPVYYKPVVYAAASSTASIGGTTATNNISPTTGSSTAIGTSTIRQPRGLAVNATAGTVSGFFVGHYDVDRISYYNNTASSVTIGGQSIPAYGVGVVAGTVTEGFNTDGIGNVSRLWNVLNIDYNFDKTSLLIADYDNYRVRTLDLSINAGELTTQIGVGRARSGHLGDSPLPATQMYLSQPGEMAVDNTSRKLYVSDSANGRIRRVDLLTGEVDTVIGRGAGAATTENEDPTNVFMTTPRGLALVNSSGTDFLVYADQNNGNVAANANCLIRGLNLTPASPPSAATTLFNVAINPYKVSTLVGDYTLGCQAWNTATANGTSPVALGTKIHNPEAISSDGTNLYIAMYSDHCIVKLTPAGTMSAVVGTCGTAGLTDGSTTTALIRFPYGIVVDPNYSADGNFFFTDAVDQGSGRVRYVNFRTSAVQIGSTNVPAATSPNGIVSTIWFQATSPSTTGRIHGIAAFSSQLCFASGAVNDAHSGAHNVTCYDRSSPLGPVTLRVGPSESSSPPIRGGAPLDNTTQEGIYSSGALVNGPYGLAFDSSGNLYISERNNHIVRMVRRWW